MNESIRLRDYQIECLEFVSKEFDKGISRQLIALPTGSGKTVVMAAIAMHFNKKTLLLAHREELISQAVEKFKLFWPDVDIGICMADQDDMDCQIVVGSIQSCSRHKRLERLKERGFEFLMIDEAHHSTSDSYQSVINALGFNSSPQKLLLGVTATPQRSDKLGLEHIFEQVTFSRSISTMIKGGYLSPIVGRKILTNFTIGKISSSNGDFVINDLSEAVNTPERNIFIVSKFKEYAPERKGIAFCCDVQHCKDLSDAFKAAGIESTAVWGEMEAKERKTTLEAFKNGQIQVVTSCGVLTEGYDEPSVNSVIMARPTKSLGLFTQCIGRGLRLWPGKENCLVLDFTDKYHTIDSIMSLSSVLPEAANIENGLRIEQEEIDRNSKIEVLSECDHVFDILGSTRFIWVQVDDEWSLQDDDKNEIVMRPSCGKYIADLYYLDGSTIQIVSNPLPLEYCSGVCEDYARRHLKIAFADINASWMSANSAPTQSQCEYLEKKGAYAVGMTRGQASIEIRKIIASKNKQRRLMASEPITVKQQHFLQNRGIDTLAMTKLQAMQAIYKIKNEGLKYG
jgi:superfamily II DNA or RNA helicase